MERLEIAGQSVAISAQHGTGFEALRDAIAAAIDQERGIRTVQVRIPFDRSELVDRFYRAASVDSVSHDERGTLLTGRISSRHLEPYREFVIHEEPAVLPATANSRESAA
jgi:50S ribosomal subunit-associated GTPase HflX